MTHLKAVNRKAARVVEHVEEQKIEQEEDQRSIAVLHRILDQIEGCSTIRSHPA